MAEKKGKAQEKEVDDDFRYMVRLANTDIDGNKTIQYGLSNIKGINFRVATVITRESGIPFDIKLGNLNDDQLALLGDMIDNIHEHLPNWMMNRRLDYDTGRDTHILGAEFDLTHEDDLSRLKKIRSYKGIRHATGHKVRGQRSSSNGRKGSTMGVVRKKK